MITTPGPVSNAIGAPVADWAGRRHEREIANATDVLQHAPRRGVREAERIGHAHQRCALTAHGHVARAHIADHIAPQSLGNHRRLPELPRGVSGFMPQRVPVRHRGAHSYDAAHPRP
jgi:hypothetical protein